MEGYITMSKQELTRLEIIQKVEYAALIAEDHASRNGAGHFRGTPLEHQ
jgi:hypothetical protein